MEFPMGFVEKGMCFTVKKDGGDGVLKVPGEHENLTVTFSRGCFTMSR